MKNTFLFILTISTLMLSCKKDNSNNIACVSNCYLHLSHTRTSSNDNINKSIEEINYDQFDMLWLGGDLALLSSENDNIMSRLNSIFDFGSPNTLWSLGNHDYTDINRIEQYTNRPSYYTTNKDGITIIVLDTQENLSDITGSQRDFVFKILDTIQESSHLVLLHHKLIWMYGNSELETQIASVSNAGLGNCYECLNPNNFNTEIYPKLVEIEQRGIDVLCIGGDIGNFTDEFEYLSPEGVQYLASGMKNSEKKDKALVFHHNVSEASLIWEYKLLKDLK